MKGSKCHEAELDGFLSLSQEEQNTDKSDNYLHTNLMLSNQQPRVLDGLSQSEYILQGVIAMIRHAGASDKILSSKVTIHKSISSLP